MDIWKNTPTIPAISVELAKAHLRIDHNLEDDLIKLYIMAATQQAEQILGREIVKRVDPKAVCEQADVVPETIQQYILVTVGDLYTKRENTSAQAVNTVYKHLLDPYIIYNRDPNETVEQVTYGS